MAELLAGKHTPQEDNNNCIANDKDRDDDAKGVKLVIKLDSLNDRQLRIPNYTAGDDLQEIKAVIDSHETSSWMEGFELKLDESLPNGELYNDENHDSNNDNGKDNSMKTSPSKLPISQNFCKGVENHGVVMKEIVDQKIKENVESTPKTENGKRKYRKKISTNQATLLMKHLRLSPVDSKNMPSKVQKPQVKPKKEATISTTAINLPDGLPENIFNAKVVLERLPSSLLPAAPTNLKQKTSTRIPKVPKVQIAPQSSKPRPIRKDTSSKFKRYCSKCKKSIDSCSIRKDMICLKCDRILIFLCATCNNKFETYHTLTHHRKTKCSVDKQLKYELCDYKTPNKTHLKSHVDDRHSNKENAVKNLKCSKCKREFKQEMFLQKHLVDCKGGSKKSQAGASGTKVESKFSDGGTKNKRLNQANKK